MKEKKSLLRNFILLWMKVLVSCNNFSASKYILSALLLTLPLLFYFSDLQLQTLYSFAFFCSSLLQKLCVCLFLVSNPVPSGSCFTFCFVSLFVCFFIKKDNLQASHTKYKLLVSPEKGQDDDHRAGAPLLFRQARRVRVVQSGEKKILLRHYSIFQYLKGI